jgi:hypothetical protein
MSQTRLKGAVVSVSADGRHFLSKPTQREIFEADLANLLDRK